jgi:hypothetical protein
MSKDFSLRQACVFCGENPQSKNKEHILPQWLLRLTGDPNREALLGADFQHYIRTGELKQRKFAFSSFCFPACESCNTFYAKLEARVKPVIIKTINNQDLEFSEIIDLLDWFDKVRIGL